MNVRRKVLLLLGLVVLLFGAALFWLGRSDAGEFQKITAAQRQERAAAFDRFLAERGETLNAFVKQQSSMDGLVEAIESGDWKWVEENVGDDLLASHHAQVFWVYDKDRKLVYTRNKLYQDGLHEAPVPRSGFDEALGKERLGQFFADSAAGLLEIRGATIHPAEDRSRTSDPIGYLFAARVWNAEGLKEMSTLTGNELAVVDPKYGEPPVNAAKGEVAFSKLLPGWDGAPVMRLNAQHRSPGLSHFAKLSTRLFIWLGLFIATTLGVLAFALRRWVWRPLELFATSLRSDSRDVLLPLEKERGEVGELARLIAAFFLQRESLLEESRAARVAEKEMEERDAAFRHGQKLQAIGRLAGGVAHDFSNMLTVIIGYAGLLRNKLSAANLPVRESDAILHAGQKAAGMTRQLLAFSQKQVLHPQVLDLNRLVEDSEEQIKRLIGENVEVRIRTDARQGAVRADPAQLKEVLLNLASNASDAMPRGGVLTITTGDTVVPETTESEGGGLLQGGRYITLEVADTGSGMDAETEAHIFEPFFTTKPTGQGTGLGLATVFGIVAQSGGTISVATAEDAGTTVLIHFPLEAAAVEEPRSLPAVASDRGNGETILVVEDDVSVRELICAVLEDRGYRVFSAPDGTTALEVAAEHRGTIQMLVSDAELQRKPGIQMVQQFRQRWPELKVLYVAGYTEVPVSVEGAAIPPGAIVEKPFTPEDLALHVRQLLDENGSSKAREADRHPEVNSSSVTRHSARTGPAAEVASGAAERPVPTG